MQLPSLIGHLSPGKTLLVLVIVAIVMGMDVMAKLKQRNYHYVFGLVVGTALSIGMLVFAQAVLNATPALNPYQVGLGVVLIVILWKLLFGSWETHVKAVVLGSFILWIGLHMLWTESSAERIAHLLAMIVALIPALLWALLFLRYHRERISTVLVMFFAGIVSTAPILFYDALQKRGIELDLFVVRIIPRDFNATVAEFLRTGFQGYTPLELSLIGFFITFILVALMEELSKFWVLKSAGRYMYSSVAEVMEMGVIVAIGFAFAENLLNPGYFRGFVEQYLAGSGVDWSAFIGNIAGRSVLTSMVHIVSTGMMAYFYGLVIFAGPTLQQLPQSAPIRWFTRMFTHWFGIPEKQVFRVMMFSIGLTLAVFLHAFSNFLVTLPDALPGSPRTVGDLMHAGPGSPLNLIALLLFPSLLYVGGGFWLLKQLFTRKANLREHGRVFPTDTFVTKKVIG